MQTEVEITEPQGKGKRNENADENENGNGTRYRSGDYRIFSYNNKNNYLLKLVLSLSGCRVIQNILQFMKKDNQRLIFQFIECFEKDVKHKLDEILTNSNGNHVIQKIIGLIAE